MAKYISSNLVGLLNKEIAETDVLITFFSNQNNNDNKELIFKYKSRKYNEPSVIYNFNLAYSAKITDNPSSL